MSLLLTLNVNIERVIDGILLGNYVIGNNTLVQITSNDIDDGGDDLPFSDDNLMAYSYDSLISCVN